MYGFDKYSKQDFNIFISFQAQKVEFFKIKYNFMRMSYLTFIQYTQSLNSLKYLFKAEKLYRAIVNFGGP